MNLLIVDDEVLIVKILKETINWKTLGIDRVFSAYNTAEAKAVIQENPPDIIVCDIEMPKENGLALIEWVQHLYPAAVNIILTGYPEFNYAQSAISLGVFKFLLKPVDSDELTCIVGEAVKRILEERRNKKYRAYGEFLITKAGSMEELQEWIEKSLRLDGGDGRAQKHSVVKMVKDYIESRYNENITRGDIERLVHLNPDHINREFKEVTGYSLMEYIQFFRILSAKHLLTGTDLPISEICLRVGYDSPAYFSKIFKKWVNLTPIEYRKSLGKDA